MLLMIFLVYALAVWIIFYKLKVAVLDLKAKIIVYCIGLGIVAIVFFLVQRYAPFSKDVYVQTFVVEMASQVGGRVTEVLVDEGTPVQAGSPLFKLDDEPYRLQVEQLAAQLAEAEQEAFGQMAALEAAHQSVEQAESGVTQAETNVTALTAALTSAKATIDKAQAQYDLSLANSERGKKLVGSNAITQEEYETLTRQVKVDQAALIETQQLQAQAEAELAHGRALLDSAQTAVLAAFASQRQVQVVVEPLATIDEIIAENEARRTEFQQQLDKSTSAGTDEGATEDSAENVAFLRRRLREIDASLAEAQRLRPLAEANQKRVEGRFAKVVRIRAELKQAEYNLRQTTVAAPATGHVSNLQLASGAYVSPGQGVMSFIDTEKPWVVAIVPENGLELVQPGDNVELAIALYPGEIFSGKVESIVWGAGQAQNTPSGKLPDVTTTARQQRFMVRFSLDDPRAEQPLRQGSTATAAIYTHHGRVLHIIRKIQVRIQSMLNYLYL